MLPKNQSLRPFILFLLILGACHYSSAQNQLLPNEKTVFSFTTVSNKKMVLAKDTADQYMVYRFGTIDKIEMEFPEDLKNSWNKFTYSFYLRGGGKENEGLDLNYVYFISGNYKYIIYNTYSAQDERSKCGIKIVDTITNKTIDLKGKINTAEGNLSNFRDNNLLKIGDELFD